MKKLWITLAAVSVFTAVAAVAVYTPNQYDLKLGVIGINKLYGGGQ